MSIHPEPAPFETGTPIAGQRAINLALQGGGSHGAFTWGVQRRSPHVRRYAFRHPLNLRKGDPDIASS
jgi:hypothetical protein